MSFLYPTSHNTNITVASWESTVEIYTLSTASGDNFRDTHCERSQTTKYIIISYLYEVKNKWPSIRCIPLASLAVRKLTKPHHRFLSSVVRDFVLSFCNHNQQSPALPHGKRARYFYKNVPPTTDTESFITLYLLCVKTGREIEKIQFQGNQEGDLSIFVDFSIQEAAALYICFC